MERPKLRPLIDLTRIRPADGSRREFVLFDRARLSTAELHLTAIDVGFLQLYDGTRTLDDIRRDVIEMLGGQPVPMEQVVAVRDLLDQALFLDSPAFHRETSRVLANPVRKPSCVGVYPGKPAAFRRYCHDLFTHPDSAGLPGEPRPDAGLRAVLAPHIDYRRGGHAYTFAFKELVETTPASLFVVIGTSHYCGRRRFTLTRQGFETPLGVVPTDQTYIDRLVRHYPGDLFAEEWAAHVAEHSIELEVVLLHYLFAGKRDIRVVPLLVGSMQDCVDTGTSPLDQPDVRAMVDALQTVERETSEPICYVISGDLAHIGPKFGADHPLLADELAHSKSQDAALMAKAEEVDREGYFRIIAEEGDGRNICGLSPTWLTLAACEPGWGRLLRYDQYVEPNGHESVSFASVAFYR